MRNIIVLAAIVFGVLIVLKVTGIIMGLAFKALFLVAAAALVYAGFLWIKKKVTGK